ncbi:aryl-sulfate sulfotransferase [Vibrio sp. MACH09]|uniref:ribbon-helix-helix domain-containing protein n=1 Tax=unclassified Vibrio TaxID=2614977 RepID=UPI001493ACE1|nr:MULTISPECIES: ribbon-helix-helix domain-containing protein [unclassified Vibrio]NOI68755.1 ribbon-helix-helix domain-containing protein [Vibrio sp. 99-8-1]GLO60073.1 aryl-sulfate sulfotransferase [Vibrio sp. MACH09]
MCLFLFGGNPSIYCKTTRSVRICGQVTSIRLENIFWDILNQLSHSQGKTIGLFISKLYIEALDNNLDMRNFTSLLRCACITYLETHVASKGEE